jgi:hypothetical protein
LSLQGEIKTNHEAEKVFEGAAPEVVFVRPGYFMENWAIAMETLVGDDLFFYTTVTPLDFKMPMVSRYLLSTSEKEYQALTHAP